MGRSMRSAEPTLRTDPRAAALGGAGRYVLALAALWLSACATTEPPAPATAPPPAAAPAAAAAAPPPPTTGDIAPATQRAFDAARRALAAGRLEEAERGFLALTRTQPALGGPHANLGVIYRQTDRLPQAVAAFERAIELSPRQPAFHNQLGITQRQAGRFALARAAYEQALEVDPNYAPAVLNLGILFDLYLGERERALPLYERYATLVPGDEPVRRWIADLKNRVRAAATSAASPASAPVAPAAERKEKP
jgi:Flp pilus assembly protein TadD